MLLLPAKCKAKGRIDRRRGLSRVGWVGGVGRISACPHTLRREGMGEEGKRVMMPV